MAGQYEISLADQIEDVRPWGTRTAETLSDPFNFAASCGLLIAIMLFVPVLMVIAIPLLLTIFIATANVSTLLPLRYPPESINPDNGKKGNGIWFIGNMEVDDKKEKRLPLESIADRFKEVWLADDDMRKHLLILGSTGSGKSELLKGIFFCSLCWGSGFFVADGKADNKLPLDTFNLARFFGRDDDLLSLNFLLAGKTPEQVSRSRKRRTNKTNPFSVADSDTIIQMGANLLPKAEGESKQWQEKALNCWRGLVPALCWMRDNEGMEISVTSFTDYLALPKLEELYAKGYVLAQQANGVWNEGFIGLKAYLEVGLPGFKLDRCLKKFNVMVPGQPARPMGGKPEQVDQDATAYDQHGYRASQLNPALNLLDKTYGHIFKDKFSEIDMVDVTLNNRILVMMIPSLEKSAQEAQSLGKLTVACLRIMMGKNLGADIEGSRERILESKATEARYPYVVALDELGYYFSDGIAVMFAQARSLGFSMIAAAQDIEKLTEGDRAAEAGAMLANQVTKFFMRIDDANKTNEMIQKYLGEVNVALRKSYEYNDTTGFKRQTDVSIEKVPVATLQNLQGLGAGKAIINTMGLTFKVATFFVGDFLSKYPTQQFHINRFLQVRGLTKDEIEQGIRTLDGLEMISLPMDVLSDKQVKGFRMMELMTGAVEMPDIREQAEIAPYAEKHEKAVELVEAVARIARNLPPNIVGAQRSIILYRVARQFMLDRKNQDAQAEDDEYDADDEVDEVESRFNSDAKKLNLSKSGEGIAQGSGTGEGNSLASPHDDDPFSFLNDSKPLIRKSISAILPVEPVKLVHQPALAPDVMELIDEGSLKPVPAPLPSTNFTLPAKISAELQAVIQLGQALNFDEKFVPPPIPTIRSADDEDTHERKVKADAKWIGRALVSATEGLSAKGDTAVGFTVQTKNKFVELEAALGNQEVTQSASAIERLVAQKITPTPMDVKASGAGFDDILSLMSGLESAIAE